MAKNDKESRPYPPVLALSTLTNLFETLKSTTVPPVIDNSLLMKMSGSARSALMSAMRWIGLIDSSGRVTEKLRTIVKAYGTSDWKETLGNEFLGPYGAIVLDLDLDTGTQSQLYEAFRTKGNVDGQMLDKAVRFYLSVLTEAGLTYSPFFKTKRVSGPGGRKKPNKRAPTQAQNTREFEDPGTGNDPFGNLDDEVDWAKFQIPIPLKGVAHIALPIDIDVDDWEMVSMMLDAYVRRLTKQ